jgi:hypothetical protein
LTGAHSRPHPSSAARLGLTLRSVMLTPRAGYASAFRAAERRERAGERLPEGVTPYVLAALGGAGAMCLWLKLGALVGWRTVGAGAFDAGMLSGALAIGALLSVACQHAWGALGPRLATRLGGRARARDLRLAWGAAAFPLVFILILVPVDLSVAGPAAFTIAPLADSVVTAWVALSSALATALGLWSAWLFLRGTEVATSLRWRVSVLVALGAGICVALITGACAWAGRVAVSGPAS